MHKPVLLQQAINSLEIKPNGIYVDGTFGCGGHSEAILQNLEEKGRLIALDRDLDAINMGKKNINDFRFELIHSEFSKLYQIINNKNLLHKVDGILFDFGVSSPQLENAERGFSFQNAGPLDMRMNQNQNLTAMQWLNTASEVEIAQTLWQYGEEKKSRQIAHNIIEFRKNQPLSSTDDLVFCVKKTIKKAKGKHPATRTFQAVRIFINQELQEIKKVLVNLKDILTIGGKFVAISFHSLEDRIIKNFLHPTAKLIPKEIPLKFTQQRLDFEVCVKKIKPTREEMRFNPRARSAILRVARRIS